MKSNLLFLIVFIGYSFLDCFSLYAQSGKDIMIGTDSAYAVPGTFYTQPGNDRLTFTDGSQVVPGFIRFVDETFTITITEKEFIGTFQSVPIDCIYCLHDTESPFVNVIKRKDKKLYKQLRKQKKYHEYFFRQGDAFFSFPVSKEFYKKYRPALGYTYHCRAKLITAVYEDNTYTTVVITSMRKTY